MENTEKYREEISKKSEKIEKWICKDAKEYKVGIFISSYGYSTIKIRHEKYNWTEFVEIHVNMSQVTVDFSHSSGGWNKEISAEDRIEVTVKIFNMVKHAIDNKDELFALVRDYIKSLTKLSEAMEAEKKDKIKNKIEDAKKELLKTHQNINVNEVMRKIDNGETVEITELRYNDHDKIVERSTVKFYCVHNKRKSYRMNDYSVKKSFIHNYLVNTPNLFMPL